MKPNEDRDEWSDFKHAYRGMNGYEWSVFCWHGFKSNHDRGLSEIGYGPWLELPIACRGRHPRD